METAADTTPAPGPWLMWAGVDSDHRFAPDEDDSEIVYEYPAADRRYAQWHGCREIVRILLTEDADGAYWGWLDNPSERNADPEPAMIFRRKVLFQVCFPYGPEAEEKAGRGRVVRLRAEPAHPCRSDEHVRAQAATVTGVFDCGFINNNPPEPNSYYCLRCAVKLHAAGMFTPTDGTELPSIEQYLARHGAIS